MKWEDVGGLEDVKKAILDTVQVSLLITMIYMEKRSLNWLLNMSAAI